MSTGDARRQPRFLDFFELDFVETLLLDERDDFALALDPECDDRELATDRLDLDLLAFALPDLACDPCVELLA